MKWIKDEEFIRGSIPMTKFDARVLILALLEIEKSEVFLDIGAGTGSISIQAAMQGAEVFAIEKELEGIELIKQNEEKFGVNVKVIHGSAPNDLQAVPTIDKCFIGGSAGKLTEIINTMHNKLKAGGILAASFIVPDNMVDCKRKLKELNYADIEVRMIQSSIIDNIGLMKANNPIFIIKGKKQ